MREYWRCFRASSQRSTFCPRAERRGFSANYNDALRCARGRYLVILNDDTVLCDNAFGKMIDFLEEHSEVGGIGPRFLNPDGSFQLGRAANSMLGPLQVGN